MLRKFLNRIGNDTSGATAVEYGLIVSLVVIACIVAIQGVAGETIEMWSTISTEAAAAME